MKINLISGITVQQDSVVSKTIVKKEGGNITVFAFDKGQALSEHTAPYDATFHCIAGSFLVTIDSIEHTINKDELIIFPAGKPHSVTALLPSTCLLVMIKSAK